jgi:hypothetical protein
VSEGKPFVERRNLATRPLQYRPTAHSWSPYRTIEEATQEAEDMQHQYDEFVRLKQRCDLASREHFERECLQARRYLMDAHSFLVSLRRRGYDLALEDLGVKRTLIEEQETKAQAAVGTTYSLFKPRPIPQRVQTESRYSSLSPRN